MFTQQEAIKEIRENAKRNGLTFRRSVSGLKINGNAAYEFVERGTNNRILWDQLFWTAYENCASGYLDELMGNAAGSPSSVTCEEYEICEERCWIVRIDEELYGTTYLDESELKVALGAKRSSEVINNEPKYWVW